MPVVLSGKSSMSGHLWTRVLDSPNLLILEKKIPSGRKEDWLSMAKEALTVRKQKEESSL